MIFYVILGILVLVIIHELGHFISAKLLGIRVEEFGVGIPPRVFKKKLGNTIYSINALPLGGFVKIYGDLEDEEKQNDENAFLNKPFWKKAIVVLAGVFANFLLGWFLFSIVFMIGMPEKLMVGDVLKNSPAYVAGIKVGDVIEEVRVGEKFLKSPITAESFVDLVLESKEKEVYLRLLRGDEELNISLKKEYIDSERREKIGILVVNAGFKKLGFFESIYNGFLLSVNTVVAMFEGLKLILVSIVGGEKDILSKIAGPVGVVSITSKIGHLGISYFLQIFGLISINLAVVNLLPIPALDGGRFLFFLVEKIIGKKIAFKVQNALVGFSFLILIFLLIFITFNDIKKFF